ncbi:MAG: hypothetical protein WAK72_03565, partial [Pseudolabrys sp.]
YTLQLGNGFSASLSAEDRRTTQIIGQGITSGTAGTVVNGIFFPGVSLAPNVGLINGGPGAAQINTGLGYGGWQAPDIVGNLRVDQAWGSAQIGGAAHLVNAQYYINAPVGAFIPEESGNPR